MRAKLSKKAESDNITILLFLVLILGLLFYVIDWFTGGAMVHAIVQTYKETMTSMYTAIGVDSPYANELNASTATTAENLPPECAHPFLCKQPLNETTCPEIELAVYNKKCGIK